MGTEKKELKRSLTRAIAGILLLLFAAVGTSYAWFTLSGQASTNITPTGGTISKGDTVLLISASSTGPFEKTCDLVLSGNPETLKPLSTGDLEHFYRATAQNQEGISILYANADNRVDTDAIHGTVYLKCENAPCNVYFDPAELKLGNDAQALAAMRLGMKITSHAGTTARIFRLDDMGNTGGAETRQTIPRSAAVVSSVAQNGQATYGDDPVQSISGYFAEQNNTSYQAGREMLAALDTDEVATVEYWLYLEGCDEQCINAVQSRASEIQLAFAGVDAGED